MADPDLYTVPFFTQTAEKKIVILLEKQLSSLRGVPNCAHTKEVNVGVIRASLQHVVIDHTIDGLALIVIQVGDDASLGGYLVEGI